MERIIISLAALIPVVIFCWYIYSKDKQEKEPIGLLVLLFLVGAVAYLPAILVENSLIGVIDKIFSAGIEYAIYVCILWFGKCFFCNRIDRRNHKMCAVIFYNS